MVKFAMSNLYFNKNKYFDHMTSEPMYVEKSDSYLAPENMDTVPSSPPYSSSSSQYSTNNNSQYPTTSYPVPTTSSQYPNNNYSRRSHMNTFARNARDNTRENKRTHMNFIALSEYPIVDYNRDPMDVEEFDNMSSLSQSPSEYKNNYFDGFNSQENYANYDPSQTILEDEEASSTTEWSSWSQNSPRKTKKRSKSLENTNNNYVRKNSPNICRFGLFPDHLNNIDMNNNNKKDNRIERGGVIVYTYVNGQILFGLGVDTKSGDITDFGGGVSKFDGTIINGALREFKEESLGIFGSIQPSELRKFITIYNKKIFSIFIKFNVQPIKINQIFQERVKMIPNPEVKDIMWFSEDNFIKLIKGDAVGGKKIFFRIQPMLYQAFLKRNYLKLL